MSHGQRLPGHHQRRHPRFGARLVAVRGPAGARGSPERRLHRPRRRRLLGDEQLRRPDRHAEHRPDRGRRRALHAVAHDRPLLADALLPADRPQPHPQQHGLHHRRLVGLPERERRDPTGERDAVRDPRRARLEHLHGRQVASLPDRRDEPRGDAPQLAERPRVRTLVRLPGRRIQPVVPGPRLRQPPGGPAEDARGGLPPLGGHHGQGDRVHQRREGDRARQAVLPVLRPRRGPCAAPRPEGVVGPLQGPLRPGLRGDARADARPPEGARPGPPGDRAAAAQPDRDRGDAPWPRREDVPAPRVHQAVGHALGRREAAVRADGRGLRGLPVARGRPDRPAAETSSRRRDSARTRS